MQFVPTTGPWFMTYRVGKRTLGVMLATGGRDVALSGGAGGRGLIAGWRFRKRSFRDRKFVLGREG